MYLNAVALDSCDVLYDGESVRQRFVHLRVSDLFSDKRKTTVGSSLIHKTGHLVPGSAVR